MEKQNYYIVVSSSDEYFLPLKTMLYSLFRNNQLHFTIFFLGELSDDNKKGLNKLSIKYNNNIEYVSVDDSLFMDAPNSDKWFRSYYKIMIPYILPSYVDYCLWIDSDIIVDGDIKELFCLCDYNKPIGGCSHNPEWNIGYKYEIGIDGRQYDSRLSINAGIILFNNKFIKNHYSQDDYYGYFMKYKNQIKYADQDFLNSFFNGNIFVFEDNRFNCLVDYNSLFKRKYYTSVVIFHYYYFKKPWIKGYLPVFPFLKYWKYGVHTYKCYYSINLIIIFLVKTLLRIIKKTLMAVISRV